MSVRFTDTVAELTRRLAEAEATIQALLSGQVDAVVDIRHKTPVLLAKAQESLRQSEERYRHIVDATNEGVWLIDREHKTTFMNRRMAEMLRCDASAELGRSPAPFLDDIGREALLRHFDNPAIHQSEVQLIRTDDTRFWVQVEGVPMFDSTGAYEGSLAMIRDVSDRRAAEMALRKTTADLVERTNVLEVQAALLKEQAALLDLPTDAIVVRDLENRIVFWSRGAEAMYGWTSREALGRCMEDLVRTACPEPFATIRDTLLATGQWEGEGTHERRDGTRMNIASRWTLQRDPAGHPLRILSISNDITARRTDETERRRLTAELEKQAAALRENERRTIYALGAARMGVWELDLLTRHVTWSETMPAVHGLAADQSPSTAAEFLQVIHPDDRAMVETALQNAVLRRGEFEAEFRSVWPDGTTHWNAGRARVLCDDDGVAVRVLGVTTEISDRKSLEAQFQQSQKMEAVGQLAGGVAHDFNNLLTVVLGYSGFVMETFGVNDPRRGDMDEIVKAGQRATAVTRQLLAFSRKQVLQPTNVDLNALVLGMQEMLGRLIGEDIEIVQRLAPDLGVIRADPGQLEQVLMNLAVNARDAMPSGGLLSFTTANANVDDALAESLGVAAGPYVLLAVTDDGLGMSESVRQRLFEPFFTTKEPGKGTGLGLATVYGIVKQSGGTVGVASVPGNGTTFQVYLPRSLGAADAASEGAFDMPLSEGGHETVLVVEDESGVRLLTRRILEKAGYRVLDAADGDQAEALFAIHRPAIDLLITDVIMPGMSGPKLFERLVQQRPGLKVLYVSGYTDAAIVHQGQLDPGIEFLQKPFTTASLNRRVRDVLEGRSSDPPSQWSAPRPSSLDV